MKVGLMGLGRGGQQVASALLSSSWSELVAVASPKSKRIERFTEEHPEIVAYDDFRSLIVENPLDALFVAVPPFLRTKYLTLAAERGLPVWMLTPPARHFDDAQAIMNKFRKADVPVIVSRTWGIEPAMQAGTMRIDRFGRFFFARGNVMTSWSEDLDWRGDVVRAGGGVLLDRAYSLIDTVVQAMGVPRTVNAAASGVSRPGGRFPYDTEDTAGLVCRFSGGAIAVLSACWTSGPDQWGLDLHGTEGSVQIDELAIAMRDRAGTTELGRQDRPANPLLPQIEQFLSSLRTKPDQLRGRMREHLPTMAVIEAAYLSARTGQPESPGKIFEAHDVRPSLDSST